MNEPLLNDLNHAKELIEELNKKNLFLWKQIAALNAPLIEAKTPRKINIFTDICPTPYHAEYNLMIRYPEPPDPKYPLNTPIQPKGPLQPGDRIVYAPAHGERRHPTVNCGDELMCIYRYSTTVRVMFCFKSKAAVYFSVDRGWRHVNDAQTIDSGYFLDESAAAEERPLP